MTAQLEIPPAAIAAACGAFYPDNSQPPPALMQRALEAAAPHLFSLFAERLTSDEAVEAAFTSSRATGWDIERMLEAVAAALVPGREDGQRNG